MQNRIWTKTWNRVHQFHILYWNTKSDHLKSYFVNNILNRSYGQLGAAVFQPDAKAGPRYSFFYTLQFLLHLSVPPSYRFARVQGTPCRHSLLRPLWMLWTSTCATQEILTIRGPCALLKNWPKSIRAGLRKYKTWPPRFATIWNFDLGKVQKVFWCIWTDYLNKGT